LTVTTTLGGLGVVGETGTRIEVSQDTQKCTQ
jgi:hypothetical protein